MSIVDSAQEMSQIRGAERDAAKKYVGSRGPIAKATRKVAVAAARKLPKGRARDAMQELADATAPTWYERLEQRRAANLAAWLAGTLTDDQLIEASPDELPHDPQVVEARKAALERRADQRAEAIYRDALAPRIEALPAAQQALLSVQLRNHAMTAEEAHHALNFAQAVRALDGEPPESLAPLMEGINYASHGGKYLHSLLENRDPENMAASRAAQVMAKRVEQESPQTAELFRDWGQSIQSQWDGASFNQDAGDKVEQQRKQILDAAQTLGFVPSADDYESVTRNRQKQATELRLSQERAARERAKIDFAANMVAKNTVGKKQEKLLAKLQKDHGLSEYQASHFSGIAMSSVLANPKQKWASVVKDTARRIKQEIPAVPEADESQERARFAPPEVETREQELNRKHVNAMREQLEMEQRQHPERFAEDWLLEDPMIQEIHRELIKSSDSYRELSNRADEEVASVDTDGLADGDYPKVTPIEFERQKQLAQEHLLRFPDHTPEFAIRHYGLNLPTAGESFSGANPSREGEQRIASKQLSPTIQNDQPISSTESSVATKKESPVIAGAQAVSVPESQVAIKHDLQGAPLNATKALPAYYHQEIQGRTLAELLDMRDWPRAKVPPQFTMKQWKNEMRGRIQDWVKTEQDQMDIGADDRDTQETLAAIVCDTVPTPLPSPVPEATANPPSKSPELDSQSPEFNGLPPKLESQPPELEPEQPTAEVPLEAVPTPASVTTSPPNVTTPAVVTLPLEAPTPIDSVPVASPETSAESQENPRISPASQSAQPQSIPQHGTPPVWSKEQRESDKNTLLEYLQTSPGVSVYGATQIPGLSGPGSRRRNMRELLTELAVDGTLKQERTGLTRQERYSLDRAKTPSPETKDIDWKPEHQANDLRALRDQAIEAGSIDVSTAMANRHLSPTGATTPRLAQTLARLEQFEVLERFNTEQRGAPQYRPTKAARMEAAAERVRQPLPDVIEYTPGGRWKRDDYQKDMEHVLQQVLSEGKVDIESLQRNKQISMHGGTAKGMQRLIEDMQAAGGLEESTIEPGKPQLYQLTTAALDAMKAEYRRSQELQAVADHGPATLPEASRTHNAATEERAAIAQAAVGQGLPPRKPPEAPPAAPLPPDDDNSDPKRRPSFEAPPTPEEVASAEILETLAGNPIERDGNSGGNQFPSKSEGNSPNISPAGNSSGNQFPPDRSTRKPTDSQSQPNPKPAEQPAPKQGKLRSFADKIQLGLDIAGAIDPTPAFDTGNAMISLMRGLVIDRKRRDHHLQNAAISASGAIWPGIGDLAKLMKFGRTEPAKQAKFGYQQTQEAVKQERRNAAVSAVAAVSAPTSIGGESGQAPEAKQETEAKASDAQQTAEAAVTTEQANGTQVDVPGRQVPNDPPGGIPGAEHPGEAEQAVEEKSPGGASGLVDKFQLGLDVVGAAEPTPFADGANAAISLFRGFVSDPKRRSFHLKNAAISAAGAFLPYIGDAAKLGKLGKFASGKYGAKALGAAESAVANAKRRRAASGAGGSGDQPPNDEAQQATATGGSGGGSIPPPNSPPSQPASDPNEALVETTEKLSEGFGGLLKKLGPFGDVVGTAAIALGAMAARAVRFVNDLSNENGRVLDGLRPLANVNGNIAMSFAQANLRDFQRDIKRGEEIAPQVSQLSSSQSDLKDLQSQFSVPLEKLSLELRGLKTGIIAGVAKGMDGMTGASDKLETVSQYLIDGIKAIKEFLGIKQTNPDVPPWQGFLQDIGDGKFDGKAAYMGGRSPTGVPHGQILNENDRSELFQGVRRR